MRVFIKICYCTCRGIRTCLMLHMFPLFKYYILNINTNIKLIILINYNSVFFNFPESFFKFEPMIKFKTYLS